MPPPRLTLSPHLTIAHASPSPTPPTARTFVYRVTPRGLEQQLMDACEEARQQGQIGLQPGYLRLQPKTHRVAAWPGGPWQRSTLKGPRSRPRVSVRVGVRVEVRVCVRVRVRVRVRARPQGSALKVPPWQCRARLWRLLRARLAAPGGLRHPGREAGATIASGTRTSRLQSRRFHPP